MEDCVCPCANPSNPSEQLIFCEGECHRWFHSSCAGLSDEQAEILGRNPDNLWFCFMCAPKSQISASNSSQKPQDLISCPHCSDNLKLYKGSKGLNRHIKLKHAEIPSSTSSQKISDLSSLLPKYKQNIKILKRIPKGARYIAGKRLAETIDHCISNGDTSTPWEELLTFTYIYLRLPDKSTKGSLTTKVKKNLTSSFLQTKINEQKKKHIPTSVSRRVESKVAEGDIRGAVNILSSDDTIAPLNESTFNLLKEKHPPPSKPPTFPSPPEANSRFLTVTENEVKAAILSFPNGSSAGIDGLRPQHLKDMLMVSNGDSASSLLTSVTKLMNIMLAGKVHTSVLDILYGANLCALKKSDGGIRPIAVGNCFRRLAAKLACYSARPLGLTFQPRQVGFATKGGCEASVHAVRTYSERNENNNKVLLMIDFKNAFNCIDRDAMLHQVQIKAPELYNFLWQCYSEPTSLFFGDKIISSTNGCQQGDPAGPLLFCLTLQPVIEDLQSEFVNFYLDDGTLGGDADAVISDFQKLIHQCSNFGLHINPSKCKVFFTSPNSYEAEIMKRFDALSPGIRVVDQINLLGCPISSSAQKDWMTHKQVELNRLFSNLEKLDHKHVAYYLLRNCFAVPKLTYFLRTSPTWLVKEQLLDFDMRIKTCMENLSNISLDENKWTKATLPIKFGGLGISKLTDLCLPAFLSSVNSTLHLVQMMLNVYDMNCTGVSNYADGLKLWEEHFAVPAIPSSQKNWDNIRIPSILESLPLENNVDKARFNALLRPESNAWLHALPARSIGTLLENNFFRICIALRLGTNMCLSHSCRCGEKVGENGLHGLSSPKSAGRHSRHHELNDIIARSLNSINIPSQLEPVGICRNDGKRVDGITLIPWNKGRPLIWDATCTDTLAYSSIEASTKETGSAAKKAAYNKVRKYSVLLDDYCFVPFAVETLGPWNDEALSLVKSLGRLLANKTGEARSTSFLTQRISIAIQRGNAVSIMGTFSQSSKLDEIFYIL